METIPLQATPNQTLQSRVAGQNIVVNLYDKQEQGLFADVVADGVTLITGVLCLDAVPIVPTTYLGFSGNLLFIDTQGFDDPTYTGLGTRFTLVYLTADEHASFFSQ